jgi:hypothetical protein
MQKWFVLICLMALMGLGTLIAQLQQSGGPGSAVTITSGTVTATQATGSNLHVAVDSAPTTTVTGTITATQGTGSNLHVAVDSAPTTAVTLASLPALAPGSAVIGVVNTIPKTACTNNTVESQALAAVPTSATSVFAVTTCVTTIVLNNTTASPVTVTVTDAEGTPVNDVLTFSIPAYSQLIQPLGGVAFTSGVKWSASASGVTGAMLGYN